jgi:hypothetical protein
MAEAVVAAVAEAARTAAAARNVADMPLSFLGSSHTASSFEASGQGRSRKDCVYSKELCGFP